MVSYIVVLTVSIVSIVVLIASMFYKDIMSFIAPQNYAYVTMLEADNNVRHWIQKKEEDLRFNFNNGKYNLFESTNNSIGITGTNIYRSGRLAQFFYVEGNENPLDFRKNKITGNPILNEQMLKQDLSKLWEEPQTPIDQLMKYLVPALIIIGVIVVIVIILSKGQPPQVS